MTAVVHSFLLFVLAGLCEIGGGWLMWKWLRDARPSGWGLCGALVLILYGVIPTLQKAHFGRVYAVYGGFFIVMSLLWGWYFDGNRPDRLDVVGAVIALAGVGVMMYWPGGSRVAQIGLSGMPLSRVFIPRLFSARRLRGVC